MNSFLYLHGHNLPRVTSNEPDTASTLAKPMSFGSPPWYWSAFIKLLGDFCWFILKIPFIASKGDF
jgi:hypothetical protein